MTSNVAAVAPQEQGLPNRFADDSFGNRAEFADQVDAAVDKLGQGVLVIDAQWGEGKSWFTERYSEHLKDRGHKAIRIDAFKDDYLDDPFLMIVAEITEMVKADAPLREGIKNKAASVAAAILPVAGKLLVNVVGRTLMGTQNLSGEIEKTCEDVINAGGNGLENLFRKQIEGLSETKKVMEEFKKELTSFTAQQEKPVVIIIDELDRCRPDFAVKILEVIKHLFDAKNLFFILSMDRTQLERAIEGVYGSGIDAEGYVYKFVDLFLSLPKVYTGDSSFSYKYAQKLFGSEAVSPWKTSSFREMLQILSMAFDLSPRDMDRIFTILRFYKGVDPYEQLYLFFATVKIKKPVEFKRMKNEDKTAFELIRQGIDAHFNNSIDKVNLPESLRNRIHSLRGFLERAQIARENQSPPTGGRGMPLILPDNEDAQQVAQTIIDAIDNPMMGL